MTRWNGPVIATIDMFISLMVVFFVLASPPVPNVHASDRPVCQLAVDAHWADTLPVDIDLWVQAPDNKPVGYSNKEGPVFNLVRDDLGTVYAMDKENRERACARFLPDGDYSVNIHLYHRDVPLPINVDVAVSAVNPSTADMTELFKRNVKIEHDGQELTVIRWKMVGGQVVAGTENDIPIALRNQE